MEQWKGTSPSKQPTTTLKPMEYQVTFISVAKMNSICIIDIFFLINNDFIEKRKKKQHNNKPNAYTGKSGITLVLTILCCSTPHLANLSASPIWILGTCTNSVFKDTILGLQAQYEITSRLLVCHQQREGVSPKVRFYMA